MQKICLLCTSKGQFRNEWWEEHGHRLLTRLGEVSKILKTSIEEGYYNRLGQDCHLGILFPYRAPSHQTPQWQFLSDMRQKNGCEYRILTPPFVDIAQIFPICPLMYHCLLSCSPFTHLSPSLKFFSYSVPFGRDDFKQTSTRQTLDSAFISRPPHKVSPGRNS